jgi:hypothetical protein
MKLKNELNYVLECINKIDIELIKKHIEMVKKSKKYKSLETRIAWDLGRAAVGGKTMSSWYSKYNCNDNHIDTLFKNALKIYLSENNISL